MAAKTPEPPKDSRITAPGSAVAKVAPAAPASATTATGSGTPGPVPTATPISRSAAARRGQSGGVAAVIAVCSLLVAMGSTVIAIYSLNVARQAKSRAAAAASALDRATSPSRAPSTAATPNPTVSPTAAATPGPTYVAELVKADLRIPAAQGCASIFVDIDTLQTGLYAGHEFYLSSCLGPESLHIDQTAMAATAPASPTPESCAALLASPTASPQLVLAVYSGLTFCLLTSKDDAVNQGLPQRLAIVEIRTLNQDHSVTAVVSTYRVPV